MLFNRQSMARRLLSKLQSPLCLLFPEVCHLCGIQVAEPCDGYICRLCAVSMRRLVGPVCQICGLPEEGRSMNGFLCPDCHPDRFAFASARSAVEATPSMLGLIHQFKYHGATWLVPFFHRLIHETWWFEPEVLACDGILPVPLHAKRQRERGFNQSAVLGRGLINQRSVDWLDGVMKRIAPTTSQTMLSRELRFVNMKRAFEVCSASALKGRRLLLLDDVLTSGATAEACARECLRAGARSVIVRTLARGLLQKG